MNPNPKDDGSSGTGLVLALAILLFIAGCASSPIPTEVPTAQSIQGLTPSGTVTMTEVSPAARVSARES
jgi:hypothetical protein